MSDEVAFLQAIRAKLLDDLPRLVYADWLEERGDLRHEFLRLECELVRTWGYTNLCPGLFARLAELRAQFDPDWLAQVRRCTTPAPPVDVAEVVPALKPMARTTVRLHPRPGEAPIDASKIGGKFFWPAKEDWPHCTEHDCPFVCALQLRKEDVPEVGFKPGTDLFQLLWCPRFHEPDLSPDVKVRWWKRAAIGRTVKVTRAPDDHFRYIPQPCVLYPERVIDYPGVFDARGANVWEATTTCPAMIEAYEWARQLTSGDRYGPDEVADLYHSWLGPASGMKVAGHPEWVQNPAPPACSCGATMQLLVQFSSREYDGGTWGRWIPIQDREVLTWDYEDSLPVAEAMGLRFGDVGNMYVFHCPTCETRPTRAFMQH